ncbi:MAG: ATP-binding protein [Pseudomonadota bacterium]
MRLNAKLSLLLFLVTITPVFAVGFFSFQNSRESILQQTINHLVSTNLLKKAELDRWIDGNSLRLEILARTPFFKNIFPSLLAAQSEKDAEHMEAYDPIAQRLIPMVEGGELIEIFILRASDGKVVISTSKSEEGKFKDHQPYFIRGKTGTAVQNIYYSMSLQKTTMTIGVPLKDTSGTPIAVLAGRLNLAALSAIMEMQSGMNRTDNTFLVNKFNFFVTEPKFGNDFALKKSVHTEGVQAALAHREGVGVYPDYRGVMVIGAYQWLPKWELCLITEVEQAEAYASIHHLRDVIMQIAVVVSLLSALAGWLCAFTVTRPLSRLTAATEEIGKGNLDIPLNTSGRGEFAALARAFDRMILQLNQTLVSRDALQVEINERKRAETMREQALVEMKRSNDDLQQFAYIASHDLQEPLRMVSSFTQLLANRYNDALDEKAKQYIHYAVDGAQRMQQLIEDLLAYSRVTTRGEAIAFTKSQKAFDSAIENLRAAIAETGARITHDPLPTVQADATQLEQVFQNLIGNAIKFHGDSPPQIHVSAAKNRDEWQFGVADNGIGIDSKYADKVFVLFQRLHSRGDYPGTGIGLSLCKRIIERHGGTIWFESQPGQGTIFYFTLREK